MTTDKVEPISDWDRERLVAWARENLRGDVANHYITFDVALTAAEAETASIKADNEKLREALINLNAELDAYWNDEGQAGKRPPEYYIQRITNAQIASRAALTEEPEAQ